ncbi:MAG TPA: CapA family protein [Vicinamibacterales bacterium]|nr:CapA family protein [Vicinamibacterales bacterium]
MRVAPVFIALALTVTVHGGAGQSDRSAFTMALTGDSIITRPISVHSAPEFLKLMDITRGADAAFTNLEMLFHDYESYAMTESGGTWMRADPALARELVWAGFDFVSRANNHAGDYGVAAMRLTTKYVAAAGLVQAGVGESLAEAREAHFLETPKARVALVAAASTFPDHARAGASRGDIPARPGLNPLRFTTTYVVTRDQLASLKDVASALGLPRSATGPLTLFGQRFEEGATPALKREPREEDIRAIAAVVSNASRLADLTVVSLHGHEGGATRFVPADFIVTFAHAMIDAGADVFVGHGPHVLRGIEIYKGRPIFYSLGDFIFENETVLRAPADAYDQYRLGADAHVADFDDARSNFDRRGFPADRAIWESVVAVPTWRGRTMTDLKLYPISLGFGRPRVERGRPALAGADLARKILEDLARLSKPFGTTLRVDGATGHVELPAAQSQRAVVK